MSIQADLVAYIHLKMSLTRCFGWFVHPYIIHPIKLEGKSIQFGVIYLHKKQTKAKDNGNESKKEI